MLYVGMIMRASGTGTIENRMGCVTRARDNGTYDVYFQDTDSTVEGIAKKYPDGSIE